MSWEYSEVTHMCLCGKGTYTARSGANDWGQTSSHWIMNCRPCKLKYQLHTYDDNRKGLRGIGHRWVAKLEYEEAMKLRKKSDILKTKSVELSTNRYLDVLVREFENKSKKEIWKVLQANIKWYKSLGTFYGHTKGKGKREYLRELFTEYRLDEIFGIMGINDKEIQNLKTEGSRLEKQAEKLLSGLSSS